MKILYALLIFFLILLQLKLWSRDGGIPALWELRKELEIQHQKLAVVTERNRALQAEVEDLKSGLDSVEERARLELGMIKSGETFYQLVDSPDKPRWDQ